VLSADGSIRWRSDNLDEAVGAPCLSAARTIAACFDHSEDALRVPLSPGDLLIVDNTRVMHARTWFNDPDRLLLRVRLWRP
jgi:alpha-ketoglutarate-dependent taurine dioxygenase